MGLVLTRKPGEAIIIGDNVEIRVLAIKGGQVKIDVNAPRTLSVHREEIYEKIQNKKVDATLESRCVSALNTGDF